MSDVFNTDRAVKALLDLDPLDSAEDIVWDKNEISQALGFGMHQAHHRMKHDVLVSRGDTTFGSDLQPYIDIIVRNGFEEVLVIPFKSIPYREGEAIIDEAFYIYARRDGFLLTFDSYDGKRVNGGHLYYNVEVGAEIPDAMYGVTSSGGWSDRNDPEFKKFYDKTHVKDMVWVGHHDCREALIFNISQLHAAGKVLPKWYKKPFLWLLHYADTKSEDYNYERINAERIAMLPQWV